MGRVFGGTAGQAGLLVAIGSVVYAGTASQAGRISAWFDHWIYPIVIGNGCLVLGLGLMGFSPMFEVALLAALILGIGVGLTLSLYRSVITGLTNDTTRGSVVSLGESFGRMTGTLTPVVMGVLIGLLGPIIGGDSALRLTFFVMGAAAGGMSIILSLLATRSSPSKTVSA